MRNARALERADDGQADCYWHDNSMSLQYLIVMQGAASLTSLEPAAAVMAQLAGRVTNPTKEYFHISAIKPELLPGRSGPLTVLLVL